MKEPEIKHINLGRDGHDRLIIFHGTSLYWSQRPTADELLEKIQTIKLAHPELTIRFDIIAEGGEFPIGSLYAYGERQETTEEMESRIRQHELSKMRELKEARQRVMYLEKQS